MLKAFRSCHDDIAVAYHCHVIDIAHVATLDRLLQLQFAVVRNDAAEIALYLVGTAAPELSIDHTQGLWERR